MILPTNKIFSFTRRILNLIEINPSNNKILSEIKKYLVFHGNKRLDPYHVSIIKKYIKKGFTVIDVGANCGDYTKLFLSLGATVHAFEPSTMFRILYDRYKNEAHCYGFALGETESEIILNEFDNSGANTGTDIALIGGGKFLLSHKVRCKRLDSFEIVPNFIKIDVEGMDYDVLKGAYRTLKEFHPVVLAEFNKIYMESSGRSPIKMLEYMDELGYDFQTIQSYGYVTDVLFTPKKSMKDIFVK